MLVNKYTAYLTSLEYAKKGYDIKIKSVYFPRSITIIRGAKYLDLDYNIDDRIMEALDKNPGDQNYLLSNNDDKDVRYKEFRVEPMLTLDQRDRLIRAEKLESTLVSKGYSWGD